MRFAGFACEEQKYIIYVTGRRGGFFFVVFWDERGGRVCAFGCCSCHRAIFMGVRVMFLACRTGAAGYMNVFARCDVVGNDQTEGQMQWHFFPSFYRP